MGLNCSLAGLADAVAAGYGLRCVDEGWIHVSWGRIHVVCGKFNQRYIMVFIRTVLELMAKHSRPNSVTSWTATVKFAQFGFGIEVDTCICERFHHGMTLLCQTHRYAVSLHPLDLTACWRGGLYIVSSITIA